MTTTSTMSGLGAEEKPTSRVLRPPGGGSSDIFGTAPETTPTGQNRRQNQRGASNIFGVGDDNAPSATNKAAMAPLVAGAEEHKIYGKGRNQSRFNPITGEPYDENGSPAAATPEAKAPETQQQSRQQQQQTASPIVGAAAQTGEQGDGDLQAAPGKARPNVHTSSRVTNPPGGKSTPLW